MTSDRKLDNGSLHPKHQKLNRKGSDLLGSSAGDWPCETGVPCQFTSGNFIFLHHLRVRLILGSDLDAEVERRGEDERKRPAARLHLPPGYGVGKGLEGSGVRVGSGGFRGSRVVRQGRKV